MFLRGVGGGHIAAAEPVATLATGPRRPPKCAAAVRGGGRGHAGLSGEAELVEGLGAQGAVVELAVGRAAEVAAVRIRFGDLYAASDSRT